MFVHKLMSCLTMQKCIKLIKWLNLIDQGLRSQIKMIDNIIILMFTLTGGALIVVSAENYINKKNNAQRALQLTKSQENLYRGMDHLT